MRKKEMSRHRESAQRRDGRRANGPPEGNGERGDGRDGAVIVCGQAVRPGERRTVEAPVGELYTGAPLPFRVTVVRGNSPGPTLFVMGALHGDELAGVEVVRRLTHRVDYADLRGTLLLVPVGNPFGFLQRSRYMPDRGDLNRSFPGSARGSPTARMAHFLMREIVGRCDYGIELHTAAARRRNVPQVRGELGRPEVRRLALAFGCPYVIDSKPPKKSIRTAADPAGTSVILYETGEILRIDEECVRTGFEGCLNVLAELGMLPARPKPAGEPPVVLRETTWVRSERGGLLTHRADLGQAVRKGDRLAAVTTPTGRDEVPVAAPRDGTVIGLTTSPLVHPGDPVCHLAW